MFYDIDWGRGTNRDPSRFSNTTTTNARGELVRSVDGTLQSLQKPDGLWNYPPRPAVFSPQIAGTLAPQDAEKMAAMTANSQLQNNPILPGMGDSEIAAAQLSRDSSGDVRRIMESMQGIKRLPPPLTVAEQRSMPQQPPLQPYRPEGGFGGIPTEESMRSTLDLRIANHPEFLKVASKDPKRAAYAYKAMTGRDYEEDAKVHAKITANRDRFNVDTVQKLIKDGAYMDKATGKLMVWDYVETPPGVGSLTGEPKAVRKLTAASPDLQRIWENTHSRVTGEKQEVVDASKMSGKRLEGFTENNAILKEPEMQAAVAETEKQLGRKLNSKEVSFLLSKKLREQAVPEGAPFAGNLQRSNPAAYTGMAKLNSIFNQGVIDPLRGAVDAYMGGDSNSRAYWFSEPDPVSGTRFGRPY